MLHLETAVQERPVRSGRLAAGGHAPVHHPLGPDAGAERVHKGGRQRHGHEVVVRPREGRGGAGELPGVVAPDGDVGGAAPVVRARICELVGDCGAVVPRDPLGEEERAERAVGLGVADQAGRMVELAAAPGHGVQDHVPGRQVRLQHVAPVLLLADVDHVVGLVDRVGPRGLVGEVEGPPPPFARVLLVLRDRIEPELAGEGGRIAVAVSLAALQLVHGLVQPFPVLLGKDLVDGVRGWQ